jgi:hypothetical protein
MCGVVCCGVVCCMVCDLSLGGDERMGGGRSAPLYRGRNPSSPIPTQQLGLEWRHGLPEMPRKMGSSPGGLPSKLD